MDHLKIYNKILNKAKFENRIKLRKTNPNYVYYENHHILPKCLGGKNEKENMQLLTAREHFICHMLLTYIHPNNRGVRLALRRFQHSKKFNLYKISARTYERIKILINEIPVSAETKAKMKKSRENCQKGKNHPMFGKHHRKDSIEKMRKAKLGKKLSAEHIKHLSEAHKGLISPRKGKPLSAEWKQNITNSLIGRICSQEKKDKISKANTGKKRTKEQRKQQSERNKNSPKQLCPYCNRLIDKMNYKRWHGDKCKYKK